MANLLKTLLVALVFAGVALLTPTAAKAGTVSFGTAGTFSRGTGGFSGRGSTISVTNGVGNSLRLSYSGIAASTNVNANPTKFVSIGAITTMVSGKGASISTSTDFAAIPEPASLLLLGTGLLGVAGAIRHKLKKNRKDAGLKPLA